jgi:hypothetical protein
MKQQIDKDTNENGISGIKNTSSTSTSNNYSKEPNNGANLEAVIKEKKTFSERWETNRFWLIRGSYLLLRSVWMIVMFIGGVLVWLISFLLI